MVRGKFPNLFQFRREESLKKGQIEFDLSNPSKKVPVSVNFHFTRKCNYECGFCFHTAKTTHLTPMEGVKEGKIGMLG